MGESAEVVQATPSGTLVTNQREYSGKADFEESDIAPHKLKQSSKRAHYMDVSGGDQQATRVDRSQPALPLKPGKAFTITNQNAVASMAKASPTEISMSREGVDVGGSSAVNTSLFRRPAQMFRDSTKTLNETSLM